MDWLQMSAQLYRERPAVIFEGEIYTYERLDSDVSWLITTLSSQLGVGDVIGLYGQSSYEYIVSIHVLVRLGCTVVPFNNRLSEAELSVYARQCKMFFDVAYLAHVLNTSKRNYKSLVLFNDYTNFNPEKHIPPFDLNRPFARILTSGTTGVPKPAELSLNAVYHSAIASALRIGHLPSDRWLCLLPLYHVGGLSIIMRAALYGTCVVLQNGFDLEAVNHALDTQGVTLASFVPTMLYRLINTRQTPPPDLRLVLLGGAAASIDLVERAHVAGFPIATTYGLTEAASQVCTQLPDDARKKPASVGKPLPFATVRVIDENGSDMPIGEVGEIIVNSPTLMTRYVDNPDATAKTLRDGWLYTGDLGFLDADGDLCLVQRRSDLIISGGENVYPVEVENALRTHPSIAEAAVVGTPHPEWGQQVAAAVVLRPKGGLTDVELIAYLRERLAGYKLPRKIVFVEVLPLNASGKVDRKAVLSLFA